MKTVSEETLTQLRACMILVEHHIAIMELIKKNAADLIKAEHDLADDEYVELSTGEIKKNES